MRKIATISLLSTAIGLAALAAPVNPSVALSRTGSAASKAAPAALPHGIVVLAQRRRYRLRLPGRRINPGRSAATRREFTPRSSILPLSVIARRVLARVPGQFRGGHLIGRQYLIKILSRSGRLVYVYADARTGHIAHIRR